MTDMTVRGTSPYLKANNLLDIQMFIINITVKANCKGFRQQKQIQLYVAWVVYFYRKDRSYVDYTYFPIM